MVADNALEVHGTWWLPRTPEMPVSGLLKFDTHGGGTLELSGGLRRRDEAGELAVLEDGSTVVTYGPRSIERASSYPRIVGVANGRRFTLENSFSLSSFGGLLSANYTNEKVLVNRVLAGAQFNEDEAFQFQVCVVELRHLTRWVRPSGLEADWKTGRKDGIFGKLVSRLLPRSSTSSGGLSVSLEQHLSGFGDGIEELGIRQSIRLRCESKGLVDLDALLDLVSDVQDLVSIATGRTAELDHCVLQHPDVKARMSGTGTELADLEYYAHWNIRDNASTPSKLGVRDMYFAYSALGGIEGIASWLRVVAPLRTELGRVMATRYSKGMFVEDRINNCAAALESFDRKRRPDKVQDLAVRLKRSATFAGGPFEVLVGDVDRWVKVAKSDRDDLAHHYGRLMKESSTKKLYLAESLYWLFILCILRMMDAPQSVFESIQGHHHYLWVAEKIGDTLGDDR